MSTIPPDRRIGEQVGALRRVLHRVLARRLAPISPRPFQHLLALRVVARGEAATQRDLAERLLIDPPAASRLVEVLVRDRLLVREKGEDRRCVHLAITRTCKPLVDAFEDLIEGMSRDAKRHLGARDFETLMRLMRETEELFAKDLEPPAKPRPSRARASAVSSRRRRSH